MGKKLLRLVWNLPASFSLPSPEASRHALKRISSTAVPPAFPAGDRERRRQADWFYA